MSLAQVSIRPIRQRMKLNAALAKTLLMIASLGLAVPVHAATPTPSPAQKGPKPASTVTTVTPTPTPEIVIPGTVLERKKGGFLSLTLEGGNFKLTFYDAKKAAILPDVAKAPAHWNPKQKSGEDRTVLLPTADGMALKGSRFVKPPFPIKVYITLLNAGGAGVENYIFNFKP